MVPLSTKTDRLSPSEASVSLGNKTSKAMADQIATVPKPRLRSKIGVVSREEIDDVERVIRIQLGLG